MLPLPTKKWNFFKKDNCPMKGAYLTESILCCTKLSCDNENLTQLDQNEHSGTMKKE